MKKTVITTAAALAATLGFVMFSVGAARTSGVPGPQAQHSHHDCDHSNHDTAHHDCAEHGTVAVAEQSSVAVAAAKEKCGACNGKGYHTMQGEEYLEQCSPCKGTGKVKGFGITVPCGKCGQTGYVTKRGKDKRANCWKCNAKGKI